MQGRISLSLSLSLVKVKVKFTQTEVYKDSPLEKIDPLRSNPAPSPTVPLLHCPHGPSMPRFSPPLQTLHPSDNQGRASTSHVGGLAALLVLKVVSAGKGTRTRNEEYSCKQCDLCICIYLLGYMTTWITFSYFSNNKSRLQALQQCLDPTRASRS